jgi:hypothetical protein
MKLRTLMLLFTIITTASAFAQTNTDDRNAVKKISVPAFSSIKLDANIDVLLIQDDKADIVFMEGDSKYFDELFIRVKGSELIISSSKSRPYQGKLSIGIPVNRLQSVEINANGHVSASNKLNAEKLSVFMNSPCKLTLATTGKVVVYTPEGFDYAYHAAQNKDVEFLTQ